MWTPGAVPGGIEIEPAKSPWASDMMVPIGLAVEVICSTSLPVQPPPRNTTVPPTRRRGSSTTIAPSGGYCPAPVPGAVTTVGGPPVPPVPPVRPSRPSRRSRPSRPYRRRVCRREGRPRPLPTPSAWSRIRLPVMKTLLASSSGGERPWRADVAVGDADLQAGREPRRTAAGDRDLAHRLLAHRSDRVDLGVAGVVARRPASSTTCPRRCGNSASAQSPTYSWPWLVHVLGDRGFGALGRAAACCAGAVVDDPDFDSDLDVRLRLRVRRVAAAARGECREHQHGERTAAIRSRRPGRGAKPRAGRCVGSTSSLGGVRHRGDVPRVATRP